MLRSLDIRDMLLVERLTLEFAPGLTVMTGETGAGKSILLDSLGFVLGWKARADAVRAGAETGEVEAVFEIGAAHPARAMLAEAGLPAGDELILRRALRRDGRRTAWVNDRRVGTELLRALADGLVELHGQQDDRGLLDARGHRGLLDSFAGAAGALAATREAWRGLRAAEAGLTEAEAALAEARREEDFLRHAVAELADLAPEPGEEAALDARRRLMQGAARVREDIARALRALGPEGATGQAGDALRWLEDAGDAVGDRLDASIAALSRGLDALAEAEQGIERCIEALDFDPGELERVEERLFAIRALARKHNVLADDLAALREELAARLGALEGGEADLAERRAEVARARSAHAEAAAALSRLRQDAAARLDAAMAGELAPLKLDRARFRTTLSPAEAGPEGAETVLFEVATHPGAPVGPLNRIASGGELSRFLLALKVCLAGQDAPVTMVFDEIDRGVGGATADAVGRRLARLASGGQVLVVTHSPQVAARGAAHLRVEKRETATGPVTGAVPLDKAARVEEIARMLAGDSVTEAARAAARALLEQGESLPADAAGD